MAWDDPDFEPVTQDHSRAILWGALAVALLAVAGIVFSLLQ
jgi:hypothetical protein